MNEFFSRLWEKIKAFGKEVWYFLSSRIFWINFGKMAGITALALFMMFWMLTCFTRHGSKVSVGNYVGKSMKEVLQLADNNNFDIVVTDSIYREDMPADIILEQNPPVNSYVKEGRTIYVKITTTKGSLQLLPDLAGNDRIDDYIESIKSRSMKVGRIDTLPDPNLSDGTIKQVLWRGRDITNELGKFTVPQGSIIDFVISKKETNKTYIPPFIYDGRYVTLEEYTFAVESAKLHVGKVISDPSVSDENSAFVIKVVGPMKELQKGDSVTVYISQKNPAGTRSDQFDN